MPVTYKKCTTCFEFIRSRVIFFFFFVLIFCFVDFETKYNLFFKLSSYVLIIVSTLAYALYEVLYKLWLSPGAFRDAAPVPVSVLRERRTTQQESLNFARDDNSSVQVGQNFSKDFQEVQEGTLRLVSSRQDALVCLFYYYCCIIEKFKHIYMLMHLTTAIEICFEMSE